MKKTFIIIAILASGFLFQNTEAQIRINVNIGSQPVWGPVGYDYADYYYIPDIDVYYSVPRHQYIYQQRGRWVFSRSLPPQYRNYDLYRGYKVVINDDPRPYIHHQTYREKYASYKGHGDQEVIRNSREPKYFQIKDHPEHNKWKKEHGRRNH